MVEEIISDGYNHSMSGDCKFQQVGQEIKEVKIEEVMSPEMLRLMNIASETFKAERLSNHKIKIVRDCLKLFENSEMEEDAIEFGKYKRMLEHVFNDHEL